jgi:integrase
MSAAALSSEFLNIVASPAAEALPRWRLTDQVWRRVSYIRGHQSDLRHAAACLWLEAGVSPTTVQTWLGHADLTTTQRYLRYLGTSADETALHRLNQWGRWGTRAKP